MGCRRIAFLNCKGGVGKTTLTVNIAAELAFRFKQRVLLVDMDAQSNSSIWLLGISRWLPLEGMPKRTICTMLEGNEGFLTDAIHQNLLTTEANTPVPLPDFHLIPAIYDLTDLDYQEEKPNTQFPYYAKFYHLLKPLWDRYDYILFDCAPHLGRSTRCAVFSSEEIYVPANADQLSNIGLRLLAQKLQKWEVQTEQARRQIPQYRDPEIRGVILNRYIKNATQAMAPFERLIQDRVETLRHLHIVSDDASILPVKIRQAVNINVQCKDSTVACLHAPNTDLASDFLDLATHIHKHPLTTRRRINAPKNKNR